MARFQPRKIIGRWSAGYALNVHTTSSLFVGHNEFGHPQFETTRSELGELLFRLKNRADTSVVGEIVTAAVTFLNTWRPSVEMIVPVPPSGTRRTQPVMLLARGISAETGLPLVPCVTKTRGTPQLKNIFDLDERLVALEGVHVADPGAAQGRRILLFDDLFRSGATMNAITTALLEQGKAAEVYALTITRTRSHQ